MKHPRFWFIGRTVISTILVAVLVSAPYVPQIRPFLALVKQRAYATITVIDDGDSGWVATGSWTLYTANSDDYQNDIRYDEAGSGSEYVTYTFTGLSPGLYDVAVNWSVHSNRATDAPFSVYNDGSLLETVDLNQENAPNDFTYDSANWEYVGQNYVITSTTLKVILSDDANEYVISDGAYIERVGDLPAVPCKTGSDSLSGTAYSDEGVTPLTSTQVSVAINGDGCNDTAVVTDGSGDFSITNLRLTGGTVIGVYTDGVDEHATLVTFGEDGNMSNVDLYQDRLIIRNEYDSAQIEASDVTTAFPTTVGSGYSALFENTSNYLHMHNDTELLIEAGTTFRPQYGASLYDVEVDGTFSATGSVIVRGSWETGAAGNNSSSGETLFTYSGSSITLDAGSSYFGGDVTVQSLEHNLIAHWKFDECQGTVVGDTTGRYDAVFIDQTQSDWITTPPDLEYPNSCALNFDEEYMDVGEIDISGTDMTISFWIYDDSESENDGWLGRKPVNTRWNFFRKGGSTYLRGGSTSNTLTTSTDPTYDTWVHIAGVWDNTTGYIYYDGTEITNGSITAMNNTSGVVQIGHVDSPGYQYDGMMDDVRIYERVLTPGEIQQLANGNPTASGTLLPITLSADLDVNGSLTLANGALDVSASDYNINVQGNWYAGTGSLIKRSGTVTLDGTNQILSGTTVFHNLTKTVSSTDTLKIGYNAIFSVSGALTLQGAASNALTLTSTLATESGSLFLDAESGTQSMQYLDVSNIYSALGKEMECLTGCVNSGNNTNWSFGAPPAAPVNITGTVYSDEGLTPIASTSVALSISGSSILDTDTTDAGGQFTVGSAGLEAGDVVTAFLNNSGTPQGVTVTIASGSTMSGVHIYQNRLIVRSETGGTIITNTHLAEADDSGDSDISAIYEAVGGALRVLNAKDLYIWNSDTYGATTFTPGGNVNVGSGVIIKGVLLPEANTVTLSGSWINYGFENGFVKGSSTVLLDGADQYMTGSTVFHNLTKTVSAAQTLTLDAASTFSVSGALTLRGATSNLLSLRSTGTGAVGGGGSEIQPYQDQNGTAYTSCSYSWNYNMGYRFDVNADGDVTQLGFMAGDTNSRTVRLYAYPAGTELASATANGGGAGVWVYTDITPVSLTNGNTYVVSVRHTGSNACYKTTVAPFTQGDIDYLGASYISNSNAMPTNLITSTAYGLADITFVAGGAGGGESATASGAKLRLDSEGSQTIDYLDVKDSDASGGLELLCYATAEECVDSGNNTNWNFTDPPVSSVSITGTVYSDEGVTPLISKEVALSVSGSSILDVETTDAGGQFTLSGAGLRANEVVTVFLNDETENAVTVTIASGSTMSGVHIYQDHLILRNETGGVISNTHLAEADNSGDADIASLYTMNGSSELQATDGTELYVWASTTFKPGSRVRTHDMEVMGTATMETNGLVVTGSLITNAGTFTTSTGILLSSSDKSETLSMGTNSVEDLTIDSKLGPVGYWKLDDGAGSTARDATEHANHGTLQSEPTWTSEGFSDAKFYNGGSLNFDGTDEYVSIPSSPNYAFGTGEFSIAGWFRTGANSESCWEAVVSVGNGHSTADSITIYAPGVSSVPSGSLAVILDQVNPTMNTTTLVNDSAWHHFVLTRDSDGAAIHLNGSEEDTASTSINVPQATTYFGYTPDCNTYFDGDIDDIRFYNYALDTQEIEALSDGNRVAGSGVYTLGADLDIDGDLAVYTGGIDVSGSSHSITLEGNWLHRGGYTPQNGTVTLDGALQTLTGSLLLYNFTKTVSSADTLYLDPSSLYSFSGALTLRGVSNDLLTLQTTYVRDTYQQPAQDTGLSVIASGGDYNVGFLFTPLVDGTISQLGHSCTSDTRTVRLFECTNGETCTTGTELASVSVTATGVNNWIYEDITPVEVSVGTYYIVAFRSGSTFCYSNTSFPFTQGNIDISNGRYIASSDALPTSGYGWLYSADFTFTPDPTQSQFLLDETSGSQTIDYLDVQNNTATGGLTLECLTASEGCVDSGNNTNWNFGAAASDSDGNFFYFFGF